MEREKSSAEFIGRLRRPRGPVRTPVARDDTHEVKYLEMIDQLQVVIALRANRPSYDRFNRHTLYRY